MSIHCYWLHEVAYTNEYTLREDGSSSDAYPRIGEWLHVFLLVLVSSDRLVLRVDLQESGVPLHLVGPENVHEVLHRLWGTMGTEDERAKGDRRLV